MYSVNTTFILSDFVAPGKDTGAGATRSLRED